MKRFTVVAGLLLAATLAFTSSWADVVVGHADLRFRHHLPTGTFTDANGEMAADTIYACGNGTGLVDTTIAWIPTDLADHFNASGAVGDSITRIRVFVDAYPGSANVADLNAATITVQASDNGYSWGTVVAATGMSNWQADPQKSGSAPFFLGPTSSGMWKAYRFILTGISATTGCFRLSVAYPQVVKGTGD